MITIIIPVFADPNGLVRCLASIVRQTYTEFEVVIVDDGSPQPLEALVRQFKESRFQYIRMSENRGRGAARNVGLKYARGDLICMQDADDWALPERIATQAAFLMDNPKCDVVGCGAFVVDATERVYGLRGNRDMNRPAAKSRVLVDLLHATIMARHSFFERNVYDEKYRTAEDFLLLVRALRHCAYGNVASPLYVYRELQSQTFTKRFCSYGAELRAVTSLEFLEWREKFRMGCSATARMGVYAAATVLGVQAQLIRRRSQPVDPGSVVDYLREYSSLERYMDEREMHKWV